MDTYGYHYNRNNWIHVVVNSDRVLLMSSYDVLNLSKQILDYMFSFRRKESQFNQYSFLKIDDFYF